MTIHCTASLPPNETGKVFSKDRVIAAEIHTKLHNLLNSVQRKWSLLSCHEVTKIAEEAFMSAIRGEGDMWTEAYKLALSKKNDKQYKDSLDPKP